ncbi:MAG: hypothetical protein IKZ23_02575 [Clostridia bacterium]|nr:hypothetical protein [Clostridia bacterium]
MELKDLIYKYKYRLLTLACVLVAAINLIPFFNKNSSAGSTICFIVGSACLLLLYLAIFKDENINSNHIIFLIIGFGFVVRVAYIMQTGYTVRQHDVGNLQSADTHLAYILRLYKGEGLPDNAEWQFYQPPIWHFICSVWLKIQNLMGVGLEYACENLQALSLFLSSAIMLLTHRLFKLFNISGKALALSLAIVAFHPSFIMLAGSINNDILSLALSLYAIILAVEWYKKPTLSKIIALAFALGFAMGVKLSAGFCALGIAMLFAIKFFEKGIKNRKSIFGQFVTFGGICVPLGLWWPIRNAIMFAKPLTYVPSLSVTNKQFIGFRGTFERLFDISSLWETGVYPARVINSQSFEYFDYNIPVGCLKSSVLGEYYIGQKTSAGNLFANLLFYSAALLAIIAVICAVYGVIKAIKTKNNVALTLYPAVLWIVYLASYVKFCFDYAFFCTMDFRYIALTLILGALYIGLMLKDFGNKNTTFGKICLYGCITLTLLMSVSSVALYVAMP